MAHLDRDVRALRASQPGPKRWVVTHVGKDGMRTMCFPHQGRYTMATREEAQAWIDACMKNTPDTAASVYGLPLEPRETECWPDSYDPKQVYFQGPTGVRHPAEPGPTLHLTAEEADALREHLSNTLDSLSILDCGEDDDERILNLLEGIRSRLT